MRYWQSNNPAFVVLSMEDGLKRGERYRIEEFVSGERAVVKFNHFKYRPEDSDKIGDAYTSRSKIQIDIPDIGLRGSDS